MNMIKYNNSKLNKSLLYILLSLLFIIHVVYLLENKEVTSGFVLDRIAILLNEVQNNGDIIKGYRSFPFNAFFLVSVSKIMGEDLLNIIYIPFIQIISLFSLLTIYVAFKNDMGYKLVGIILSIYVYVFLFNSHYVEYHFGKAIFLFYIYSFYRYMTAKNNRPIYALFVILFYITIKFYAPPIEIWTFIFTVSFLILYYIAEKIRPNENLDTHMNTNLLFLLIVILFAYNPKFYEQLLLRDASISQAIYVIENFFYSIFYANNSTVDLYVTTPRSPPLLLFLNALYLFVCVFPIFVMAIYFMKNRNIYMPRKINFLIIVSLAFPFIVEFILYSSIGVFLTRYLILIFPLISIYLVSIRFNKTSYILVIFILVISLCASSMSIYYEGSIQNHKVPADASTSKLVLFFESNTEKNLELMTDHYTYGLLRSYFSRDVEDPYYFKFKQYNSTNYQSLLGITEFNKNLLHIVVNMKNIEKPIFLGEPEWIYYEPLKNHILFINNNTNIYKTYNNNFYEVYYKKEK